MGERITVSRVCRVGARMVWGGGAVLGACACMACGHTDVAELSAGSTPSTTTGSPAGGGSGEGSGVGSGSGTTVGSGAGGSAGTTVTSGALGDVDAGPINAPQPLSASIVVDQFGYLPTSEKIAVIRSPQKGFDSGQSFAPGPTYALVDAHSGAKALEAAPNAWNTGATDTSSGDKAWWFDFSSVTASGDYFVLDERNTVRSAVFSIGTGVFRPVLMQATRMYYYQRDGTAKPAQFAGADWADTFEHSQDTMCGLYKDGSAPHDLHGGWFDAGDQNRYTNWAASDVIELLRAYSESPSSFADDTNIPESGNGVPDILDEIKWEVDWMGRMQQSDGSVFSIAGHAGASPPSTDTSPCKYGPANTSAAFSTAAAFAYTSIVFHASAAATKAYPGYSDALATMAQNAWAWGTANPKVTFYNSQNGIGAGEQEVDASDLLIKEVQAAVFLFELTGSATYKSVVDANYTKLTASFDPFHMEPLDAALEYAKIPSATASVAQAINGGFKTNVEGPNYFGQLQSNADPYLAYLQAYVWGSNQTKAGQGNMFADVAAFGLDSAAKADATRYAERYAHYFHGVNPLQLVFLSNMGVYGAEKSVTRFFHTWFAHGSQWDAFGVSKYGPPPGFLTGGPNPSYAWDACCPGNCSGLSCGTAQLSPPAGQPDQKSYLDFNDSWPLDSWSVTEPDDGYQAQYVRLVSKFVQ
jgi:endoglucanase